MFLATLDIFWPITGPRALIVQQSTNAKLLGSGSVPTGPVPRAGCLMPENAVEPVAVLCRDWWIGLSLAVTIVCSPWVVAALGDTTVLARKYQTVRAVKEFGTAVHALPVTIAVLGITDNTCLCLTRVLL